jgi:hypothetical protein
MGANAQTSVPAFTAGQVLTAAQVTQINTGIPVFASSTERDAAFGGTGEKTLAEGQMAYLENTNATLVYDGASWIAVGGASGLSLVTSTSFSGSSAVSIDNCFTTNHNTYQIVVLLESSVDSVSMNLRYRVSSTDTSANYDYAKALLRESDGYFAANGNSTAATLIQIGYGSTTRTWTNLTVWEPYETETTGLWFNKIGPIGTEWGGGTHTVATSFDGFTIYPASGTITGNLYVYGMATS